MRERLDLSLVLSDGYQEDGNEHTLSLSLPVERPRGTHRRTLYLTKTRLFSTTITGSTRQISSRHHSHSTRQISSDGHQISHQIADSFSAVHVHVHLTYTHTHIETQHMAPAVILTHK